MCDASRSLELINRKLDDLITLEELAELESHLAQCPSCQTFDEELSFLHHAMMGEEDVPVDFHQNIMNQVAQIPQSPPVPQKKSTPSSPMWHRYLASAAALAVVITGGYLWTNQSSPTPTPQSFSSPLEEDILLEEDSLLAVNSDLAPFPARQPEEDEPLLSMAQRYSDEDDLHDPDDTLTLSPAESQALDQLLLHLAWDASSWEHDRAIHENGEILLYGGRSFDETSVVFLHFNSSDTYLMSYEILFEDGSITEIAP